MRRLHRDFSTTAAVAGMLAVIVSYAGSAVLIFQAARLAGLSDELTTSWIWAVSIGSGLTGLLLSWRMRMPIITAWSTPGAALLITMLPGVPFAQAVGAYIASAVIITVIGLTGSLDVIMRRIPIAVSSGMFAGILFSFGAKVFTSVAASPLLGLSMLFCFMLFRRICPRYAIAAVLVCGTVIAALTGMLHVDTVHFALARPVFTAPEWSTAVIVSIGLPLPGWDLAVVDKDGLQVGYGDVGELVIGGVGLVTTFISLLITSLLPGGLSIDGFGTWALGTFIVWIVTALATWLLPGIMLREKKPEGTKG